MRLITYTKASQRHVHHMVPHSFMQFLAPCVITRLKCISTSNKHILLLCLVGRQVTTFAVLFLALFGPTSRNKQPYVTWRDLITTFGFFLGVETLLACPLQGLTRVEMEGAVELSAAFGSIWDHFYKYIH